MASKLKTVWEAGQEIAFIKAVRDHIATLTDDEEAIRDTIEGELEAGQFDAIINGLLNEYHTACALAEARREYADRVVAEAKRAEAYAGRIKDMIREGMTAAQQRDWKGALGSVYFSNGRLKPEVIDESQVPVEYFKAVPTLDKARLNDDALKIHEKRIAIMVDATLTDKDRQKALAKLPQLPGVEIKRSDDPLNIRGPAKGKV